MCMEGKAAEINTWNYLVLSSNQCVKLLGSGLRYKRSDFGICNRF